MIPTGRAATCTAPRTGTGIPRRLDEMNDYYRTLQVTRDADPYVIERAYRALSRKHHPDQRPAEQRESATREMQQINAAYAVLSDPAARSAYDSTLPREVPDAWDVFLERGLVGMFLDKMRSRS